jgi:phosphoadenosine phosphosulfate reductase
MDGATPAALARALDRETAALATREFLERIVHFDFPGRICVSSSFGAESIVLLKLVADTAPDLPVIFLDTGWMFPETLRYKREVVERLGLTQVQDRHPDTAALAAEDPDNTLWRRDPDRCCRLRKILPLEAALAGYDAWITGIKRGQTEHRARTPRVGSQGRLIKVCPLADWDEERVRAYIEAHDLPRHPLLEQGYASIGCMPCTAPVEAGAPGRSGRWAGKAKTECGIHLVTFHERSAALGGLAQRKVLEPCSSASRALPEGHP